MLVSKLCPFQHTHVSLSTRFVSPCQPLVQAGETVVLREVTSLSTSRFRSWSCLCDSNSSYSISSSHERSPAKSRGNSDANSNCLTFFKETVRFCACKNTSDLISWAADSTLISNLWGCGRALCVLWMSSVHPIDLCRAHSVIWRPFPSIVTALTGIKNSVHCLELCLELSVLSCAALHFSKSSLLSRFRRALGGGGRFHLRSEVVLNGIAYETDSYCDGQHDLRKIPLDNLYGQLPRHCSCQKFKSFVTDGQPTSVVVHEFVNLEQTLS